MSENTFENLGLSDTLLRAVTEAGYVTPTEIQTRAIPWILQARDVIGIARTGTGKTASFTLPMIEILAGGISKARMPRALILTPTRELAAQIAENFDKYGKYSSLSKCLIVGGVGMDQQISLLQRGVDVLIATPGRLLDLFERGNVLLNDIKVLVVDEADRMLDMGFIPDIERILKLIPPIRQTLLFSATMPGPIQKLAEQFMQNPRTVAVAAQASPAETVSQNLIALKGGRDKDRTLLRLIEDPATGVVNAFVFCNRKRDVSTLARFLAGQGISAAPLHGDMPQAKRTETLQAFKDGQVAVMICSDVAARGLDITGVSHVFNYDVPFNAEDYVHRIGRTGRAGRTGVSYTLATPDDGKLVDAIEKLIGRAIPRADAPARSGGDGQREEKAEKQEKHERSRGDRKKSAEAPAKGEGRNVHGERRPGAGNRAQAFDADDKSGPGFGDHLPAFMGGGKR
ncbi:MAG: DEAD/DEAH box helicase [Rhodospirillales bacterium]|nr:DEAD/DEAH box helicase [Alphaproteobacteria bacterium]MCB9987305.1 DEAD/DEAH box helicase [Rhodospirillales bacterium]USO07839.1 MAG: DEAD/DEAH box helicase [Rhodospirillales bacterium]